MKIGFILFFIFNCTLAFTQALSSCEGFRNGNFILEDTVKNFKSYISRKGNVQYEDVVENGKIQGRSTYIVKWISECSYTLTPTKETIATYPEMPKETVFLVEIIEVKKSSYIQVTSANTSKNVFTTEMKVR